jgi:hypothetical protein
MSDPRFARLKTDPRFRKPKRAQNKVVVDQRFKSLLGEEDDTRLESKGKAVHSEYLGISSSKSYQNIQGKHG